MAGGSSREYSEQCATMREGIVLLGAGGHARSCIDVVENQGHFDIVGLLDIPEKVGSSVLGYKVLGTDDDIERIARVYRHFLVAVGHLKSGVRRAQLFDRLNKLAVSMPVIVAPTAYISKHASIGDGTIVMRGAVVNAGASIGRNCIINTGAIVEHDTTVGDFCHVSTGAILNGGCSVGDLTFIGSSATVREGIRIGAEVVVGAHSCVLRDCEDKGTYVGVPARRMERFCGVN